jgi:D-ribose pyranase
MKKSGILNKELSGEIAGLGHTDSMLIADAGFPIHKETKRIDLALIKGVPGLIQVLKAILKELVIEKLIICENVKDSSPEFLKELQLLLNHQVFQFVSWQDFVEYSRNVKCAVRTAEFTAYANIIIIAASGIEKYKKGLDIDIKDF